MKVILLRDVAKIGRRNQVIEVPDGYAQNQLIPKKWAQPATPLNLKKIMAANSVVSANNESDQTRFDAVVAQLQTDPLMVGAQPNEQGHLFKAVHEEDIIEAAKVRGVSIEKSWVLIDKPIKSLGAHDIILKRGAKKQVCTIEIIKKS